MNSNLETTISEVTSKLKNDWGGKFPYRCKTEILENCQELADKMGNHWADFVIENKSPAGYCPKTNTIFLSKEEILTSDDFFCCILTHEFCHAFLPNLITCEEDIEILLPFYQKWSEVAKSMIYSSIVLKSKKPIEFFVTCCRLYLCPHNNNCPRIRLLAEVGKCLWKDLIENFKSCN